MTPAHHKELAQYLKRVFGASATVHSYLNGPETKSIVIGAFETKKGHFYSTVGMCDKKISLPSGRYEFAAIGSLPWLPNAIASSIFWLDDRSCGEWPLVCEDVVRSNARSTYRHMVFVPSDYSIRTSNGEPIRWLLGMPVTDSEIQITASEVLRCSREIYPAWLFNVHA